MLNEIIAINNSSGTLSGTDRKQALKDGSFAGQFPFTDDPETLQKSFLSILSRLGAGTVRATPEETHDANPKLTEEQLPDGVKADDAFSEKPKGKQEKDDGAAKGLPAVCPDTLGIAMGLLSIPNLQQPTLSSDPAFHAPGSEKQEGIDSGPTVGEMPPETMANQGVIVQPDVASKLQVKEKTDLSDMGKVPAVPVEGTPKLSGPQKRDASAIPELPGPQKRDASAIPELHGLQKHDASAIPDTVNLNPVAEKINSGVKGDQTQKLSSEKAMDAAVREKAPIDQKDDTGVRHQTAKGKSASFLTIKDSAETGAIVAASTGASNTDDNETPNMFMAANQSGKIADGEAGDFFKPPKSESEELAVNFSRGGQMEKASSVNPSPKVTPPEDPSFHAEVLKQIMEKTSTNLKLGQSEIRIDLKPESLGHLRLHVSTDHQQVTVKILAENPQVKEMIENQSSLIKNELQQQGIHVTSVKVDMLMSGGSDFAYSQHEGTAFKQARHEPAYGGSGKDPIDDSASKEPDSLNQVNRRGGSIVNYFA